MVRSLAPCAISASISSSGTPAPPNPPTRIVEPSLTSASAASTEGAILSIMSAKDIAFANPTRARVRHPLRVELRLVTQAPSDAREKTPRRAAQPPLVRRERPQGLRPPLAHRADGLRQEGTPRAN